MTRFEIVAHRGAYGDQLPENTLEAFQRAAELGADAVELDVRLTADRVPIVFHSFYLDGLTSASGPVFAHTFRQLQNVRVLRTKTSEVFVASRSSARRNFGSLIAIPTLDEVLETLGGQIGFEIEVKGPEPESAQIVSDVLCRFKHLWDRIEVTSYEPMLLWQVQQRCPGLPTDLLFPRPEAWMKSDVIAYLAVQRGRLARARAVHLPPTQLAAEVVAAVRQHGIEIHACDVNDEPSLHLAADLGIPRICTDRLQQAQDFRQYSHASNSPAGTE